MRHIKYTKEFLTLLVGESRSMVDLFDKLKIRNTGGGAGHVYKKIKEYGIDRSHFVKRVANESYSYPIEDYLTNKRGITSNNLKKRLFVEGLKTKKCECCGLETWLGLGVVFQLHHIDENHDNNNIVNLQIVCPNCHSMIHTKINEERYLKPNKTIVPGNRNVSHLRPNSRKVDRPSLDSLEKDVEQLGFAGTARKYSVCDNTIRKWIKIYKKYSNH